MANLIWLFNTGKQTGVQVKMDLYKLNKVLSHLQALLRFVCCERGNRTETTAQNPLKERVSIYIFLQTIQGPGKKALTSFTSHILTSTG